MDGIFDEKVAEDSKGRADIPAWTDETIEQGDSPFIELGIDLNYDKTLERARAKEAGEVVE